MEIKAIGVAKTFSDGGRQVMALAGIDLVFRRGGNAVLLGPSGSGKTTLLNLLSGLDNPTDGEITLDGRDLARFSDARKSLLRNRSFGFVFQFFNLLPEFSVLENILIPTLVGSSDGLARNRERALALLEKLGLRARAEAMPGELSGGEQQRVAIGRALVNEPAFVFADEPTGNLDAENAAACVDIFRAMHDEKGTSFIIATHNAEIAARLGARVICLKNGKITSCGVDGRNPV